MAFVEDLGLGGIEHLYDGTSEIWNRFGISGQPAWIFLNDDGRFATQFGGLDVDGMLEVLAQLEGA